MTPSNAPSTERDTVTTPTKSAVEARQGVTSGRVVTVLVISLVLAFVAMGISWLIFGY